MLLEGIDRLPNWCAQEREFSFLLKRPQRSPQTPEHRRHVVTDQLLIVRSDARRFWQFFECIVVENQCRRREALRRTIKFTIQMRRDGKNEPHDPCACCTASPRYQCTARTGKITISSNRLRTSMGLIRSGSHR